MYIKRHIPLEQITFASSTMKTRELPLGVLKGLLFKFNLNVDNDADGSSGTVRNMLRAITRIEVIVNGQDTIVNIPGWFLHELNSAEYSLDPLSSLTLTNGATVDDYVHFYLPFEMTRGVNPQDSWLDLRGESSCTLQVTFGTATDFDANTIATINSGSLAIEAVEFTAIPDEGPFANTRREFAWDTFNIDTVGAVTHKLPTKGLNQYRRLWLLTLGGSSEDSDAEISNLKVESRGFFYVNQPATHNKHMHRQLFSIAPMTGLYVIEFPYDGRLTGRLDARRLHELTLELTGSASDGTAHLISEKAISAVRPE